MKRILLTGAGGFVGSHVMRHLLTETDWKLVCPVTFRHRGNSDRIASALADNNDWHKRVDVVIYDLSAPISGTTANRLGHIDQIWNIASDSHVDRSITNPVPFIQNNINLMLYLLEYARDIQPELFLQMSTDEVYGPAPAGYDHMEWDRILPSNPYSASKACQEAIAVSYWRTYQLPIILTNTMNIIGEMQDAEKFVPKVIQRVLQDQPVPVHVSPDNIPGSRFYLHARNLASAWLFLAQNHVPQLYPKFDIPSRFHIVGEREVDNLEMVHLIAKYLGKTPQIELVNFHQERPGHDLRYSLSGKKIKEEGWVAPISFEESLERTINWTLQHPRWLVS